ncbi:hypothetical protein ACFO6V_07130 [Promicromonospora alba]|uniref:CRISPR-associated protein Csx10 n=1 Tax=Promicromonospora alba TaxID=1616110 RepID=A0ABV9HCK9_9MICO
MLEVTITQDQDLHLGTRPRGTAPALTHTHVPGATLRGALATAWLRQHGLRTPHPMMEAFTGLFEGLVTYGPLLVDGSDVVPLSVLGCKYDACDLIIDEAFQEPSACECGPLVPDRGGVRHAEAQGVIVQRTRLELNDQTQTAQEGQLYTRQALGGSTPTGARRRFTGRIGETSTLDQAGLEFLTGTHTLWFGGKRAVSGQVTYRARQLDEDRPDLPGPTDRLVLRFYSPVVLTDSSGLPVDPTEPAQVLGAVGHDLAEVLGTSVSAVERIWYRGDAEGGWHAASRLYKPVDVVLAAGTVITVTLTDPVDASAVARLESHGLGLRRAEGFGAVRVATGPWQPPAPPGSTTADDANSDTDADTADLTGQTMTAAARAETYARRIIAAGIGPWAAKQVREYTIAVLREGAPRSAGLAGFPRVQALEASDRQVFTDLLSETDQVLDRTAALLDAFVREDQ